MNYLWIDEKNRNSFRSVLPKSFTEGKDKVCFGAYDDDGFVCGALCYRYANYQYDILWIYVVEEKRRQGTGTDSKDPLPQEGFFTLPETEQKKILLQLERECNYVVLDYEEWKKSAVPELCRVIVQNGSLMDLLLVQKRPDGNLELSYLYSKYPKGLVELLTEAAWDTESYYPKAKLVFDAMNEESASMARKLFPQAERVAIYEAEW